MRRVVFGEQLGRRSGDKKSIGEVPRKGASWEMPHKGKRRGVNCIAARGEVARIAGYRGLIRSWDQEGAPRRQRPDPHNLAHKMKQESQPFR
jgi:hypothetical protein